MVKVEGVGGSSQSEKEYLYIFAGLLAILPKL